MVKLLAIDLDGTLLNSHKHISENNKNIIRQAVRKGVQVIICSGRIFAGAKAYASELGLTEGPLIGCNGALIKELSTQELLYSRSVKLEDCLKVVELCQREGIYYHAYIGDTLFTERLEFSSLNYWMKNQKLPEEERIDIRQVRDLKEVFMTTGVPATKFVIVSRDPEQLQRLRRITEEIDTVMVMSSDIDNFEVVEQGVSKGNALKHVGQMYNIKREEIMAIGDNENDLSMIEYAGIGIAMGNAQQSIKEIADGITCINDMDGVAEAIKQYIL